MPLQLGITGGIGTGKSLVCKIFALLNIPVYDADSRAKMVMTTDGILIQSIKKEFGVLSYNDDGSLNSKFLAAHVFADMEKLEKLNALVHPRVAADYKLWFSLQSKPYVVKEAALMFETGSYKALDAVVLVTAPKPLRIKRVLMRDKQRTESQIVQIMEKQIDQELAKTMADFIIRNDEQNLVIPQVLAIHNEFIKP